MRKGSGICNTVTQLHNYHQSCLRTDTKLALWPKALGPSVAHLPLPVDHRFVRICVGRKNCIDLDLMEMLISRQGAGCTHPVNTVTSRNCAFCFTAPFYSFILSILLCYLCTSLLYKWVYQWDAAPWQCQKLFQWPLCGRKCYDIKAPFIWQLMSCGLPQITDQTLSGKTGDVWDGKLSGEVGGKLAGLLGSGSCECCKIWVAACSWLRPSEINLLQNFHRTAHILPCASCAHGHLSKMKANPSLLIAPSLLHSCTLAFRSVGTNSGEQDAASRDLQAGPHGSWDCGLALSSSLWW